MGARTVTLAGPDAGSTGSRVDDVAVDSTIDHKLLKCRPRGPQPSIAEPKCAQRRLRLERDCEAQSPTGRQTDPAATQERRDSTGRRAPGPTWATSALANDVDRAVDRVSPCLYSPG